MRGFSQSIKRSIEISFIGACFLFMADSSSATGESESFMRKCKSALHLADGKPGLTLQEGLEGAVCTGYVMGFLDTYGLIENTMPSPPLCLPNQGVTVTQAVKIWAKLLDENPRLLNEAPRITLLIAIKTAFPCK